MISLSEIDLFSLQSSLKYDRDSNGQLIVFDPVRIKFIRTTPEEMVRQMWISYFINTMKVNPKLISVERSFTINGMPRRFDLVVFGKSANPVLLAEFKSPGIRIQQAVFDQIGHYNMALNVPYSLVSNGSDHYCFKIDHEDKGFVWQRNLPEMK